MNIDYQKLRVGHGYDSHRLKKGRDFILGGVKLEHELGPEGHSDADVLLHAVIDAVLGATGQGDIGRWFPDTDSKFKDADSGELLKTVWKSCEDKGWSLINIDCVVCLQRPKVANYLDSIEKNVGELLRVDSSRVNLKATTGEKMGFVGREEGVFASATVLLLKNGQPGS